MENKQNKTIYLLNCPFMRWQNLRLICALCATQLCHDSKCCRWVDEVVQIVHTMYIVYIFSTNRTIRMTNSSCHFWSSDLVGDFMTNFVRKTDFFGSATHTYSHTCSYTNDATEFLRYECMLLLWCYISIWNTLCGALFTFHFLPGIFS